MKPETKEELFELVKRNVKEFGEPTLVAAPIRWKFPIEEMLKACTVNAVKPVFLPGNIMTNVLYIEWSWMCRTQIILDGVDAFP